MTDIQAPVSTKGRLIQVKSGMSADFSDDVLKVAEFGLILDTNELRIGLADGTTMKVNGGGGINIDDIPDASLSQKGLMTQAHVVKLDGISSGANFVQVEDNLTSTSATSALSAKQGKVLKDVIDAVGSGGSGGREYNAKITTSWSGTVAPYTQEIAISGILATDNPFVRPTFSEDNNIAIAESNAWNQIGKIITDENKLIVTCFESKPTTEINIFVKVV